MIRSPEGRDRQIVNSPSRNIDTESPTAEVAEERREQSRLVFPLRTSATSAVGCTNLG